MECVVLAAGEGKRMRPLTAKRPKVMLPLANRPMLEHLICAVRDAGISDFIFIVGYGEREIRSHFVDGSELGIHIDYAPQRHQHGTADALKAARDLITSNFLVMNGDMILRYGDISGMIRQKAPCIGISISENPGDYGAVKVENGKVSSLQEKNPHIKTNIVNAGAYLFAPDIFEAVDKVHPSTRGELELTDALYGYIAQRQLGAFQLSYWMDVGYPWDMLDANASLLETIKPEISGTVEEGVGIHGRVAIGKGTEIKSGTYIEGPCIIGRNCRIGPHTYIRGSTSIGDDCHIGHSSELKNSIIMNRTNVPHFNYIGDSIIGSGCNFGAGTKVANLRHDQAPIRVCGRDTRRKKFGTVVGDNVQFGINCSVNVGAVIGSNARFAPNSFIEGCIGENAIIR